MGGQSFKLERGLADWLHEPRLRRVDFVLTVAVKELRVQIAETAQYVRADVGFGTVQNSVDLPRAIERYGGRALM